MSALESAGILLPLWNVALCYNSIVITVLLLLLNGYPVGAFPEGNPGHWCSRFPGGHEADTSRGDNGYFIEVKDAVTQMIVSEFIPSQKYEGE